MLKINLVPSSFPIWLRHGGEDSGEIEFLDLILDTRLDMRMLPLIPLSLINAGAKWSNK